MSDLLTRLGIEHAIIQAPMAGANATPPALVAAVSNSGGIGFLGAAYWPPEQIARESAAVRALTSRPFGVNLFAPSPLPPTPRDIDAALAPIARYHAELGLAAPTTPTLPEFSFDDQLEAVIVSGASAFSFTFGMPSDTQMRVLKSRGILVFGTATTVHEARELERAGCDAVVTQGSEAGGHRGTFAGPFETSMVGTMPFIRAAVNSVRVPVIASGGIMDAAGVRATKDLGAAAVQMGTAFLVTNECGVAESYKEAVLSADVDSTRITRAFSGRPARGLVNRAMTELEAGEILPYPYQNAITRAMRNEASRQDKSEYLSLWAGQGAPLARRMPAAQLVKSLIT